MNKILEEFARSWLILHLSKCTERQQDKFNRMYAEGKRYQPVSTTVENMSKEKLSRAMEQVESTFTKEEKSILGYSFNV